MHCTDPHKIHLSDPHTHTRPTHPRPTTNDLIGGVCRSIGIFITTVGVVLSVCVSTIVVGSTVAELGRGSAFCSKNPMRRSRDEPMFVKSTANVRGSLGVADGAGGAGDGCAPLSSESPAPAFFCNFANRSAISVSNSLSRIETDLHCFSNCLTWSSRRLSTSHATGYWSICCCLDDDADADDPVVEVLLNLMVHNMVGN